MQHCIYGGEIYNINEIVTANAANWTAAAQGLTLGNTEDIVKKIEDTSGMTYDKMKDWLYSKQNKYVDSSGKTYIYDPVNVAAALLKSDTYQEIRGFKNLAGDGSFWTLGNSGSESHVKILFFDAYQIVGDITLDGSIKVGNQTVSKKETMPAIDFCKALLTLYDAMPKSQRITSGDDQNYDEDIHKLYSIYVNTYESYVIKEASETNIFSNLAAYFKETAWATSETGWKANKSVIQNALMYAILVVQSLIFFIAYVKRLFYVIMLILMAPVVVVMDFFTKFGK